MKKILILSAFLFYALFSRGQTYQFKTVGNFLVVTETEATPDLVVITMPLSNIYFLENVPSMVIDLYTISKVPLNQNSFYFSDIVDGNDAPFSSYADLVYWLQTNIGGSSLEGVKTYNLTTNTSGGSNFLRGNYTIQSSGTYGAGSLAVQYSSDDTNWVDIATFSTDTVRNIEVSGYIRPTLSGATGADLDIFINKIK